MNNEDKLLAILEKQGAMLEQVQGDITGINARFDKLEADVTFTKGVVLNLENNITQRLESLFDGYKLTHEKQWELERKVEQMERRLERLEMKAV